MNISLKYFTIVNALGFIGWLPICGISFFLWEDAGDPLILLAIVGIYLGTLLSLTALVTSSKNISASLQDVSIGSKSFIWIGSVVSLGLLLTVVFAFMAKDGVLFG